MPRVPAATLLISYRCVLISLQCFMPLILITDGTLGGLRGGGAVICCIDAWRSSVYMHD